MDTPLIPPAIAFRNTDEVNLWNQWLSIAIQCEPPDDAVKTADICIAAFRERMKGVIVQTSPGRA